MSAKRPDDRGPLAVELSLKNGEVFLDFKTAVRWLSLPAAQARILGEGLILIAGGLDSRAKSSAEGREG